MSEVGVLVRDIVGHRRGGDVGLELEVESSEPLPDINTDPWRSKIDESLRGYGMEYYTSRPIKCDSTKYSTISRLTNELSKNAGVAKDSPRTSLHVHVNILDHTPLQTWTAAASYWLLENLMVKYCGEEQRKGNLFCLPLNTGEGVLSHVYRDLENDIPFERLLGDTIRYSGQNLNAVMKFGSIEYRSMRGVTDAETIDRWSTQLYNIVHRSKRFTDPASMLDTYLSTNPTEFMLLLLDRSFVEELQAHTGWPKLIDENVGLLSEMCYYHEWSTWNKKINVCCKALGLRRGRRTIDDDMVDGVNVHQAFEGVPLGR